MRTRYLIVTIAFLMLLPNVGAAQGAQKGQKKGDRQSGVSVHRDGWDREAPDGPITGTSAPAPKRDLSGIWEPYPRYRGGVAAQGALEYPADGKPQHELPFTPLGREQWKAHKPGWGITAVPIAEANDPFDTCDPIGFPRIELFNLRAIQFWQNKNQTQIIYQNSQAWRNIWTDGRNFPEEMEPRWYGYSIGKWTDDYTFVVETRSMDERTWIDNVGRPHSDQLKVTETFHRVNKDIMEITLTIDDPKMYTKPWNALNKFQMRLDPESFDIREQICAPSESVEYNKTVAEEAVRPVK